MQMSLNLCRIKLDLESIRNGILRLKNGEHDDDMKIREDAVLCISDNLWELEWNMKESVSRIESLENGIVKLHATLCHLDEIGTITAVNQPPTSLLIGVEESETLTLEGTTLVDCTSGQNNHQPIDPLQRRRNGKRCRNAITQELSNFAVESLESGDHPPKKRSLIRKKELKSTRDGPIILNSGVDGGESFESKQLVRKSNKRSSFDSICRENSWFHLIDRQKLKRHKGSHHDEGLLSHLPR
jgi:hypothetical protein